MQPMAMAGVAQWIELRPANVKAASSIPTRAYACFEGEGDVGETMDAIYLSHLDISLPLFLPPFPSL